VVGERGVYGESVFSRIRRAILECEVVRGQESGVGWYWEVRRARGRVGVESGEEAGARRRQRRRVVEAGSTEGEGKRGRGKF